MSTKTVKIDKRILVGLKWIKFCKEGYTEAWYLWGVYASFQYMQIYICVDIEKVRVYVRPRAKNFKC